MQVIHDNTGITHAVLGKGETLDFRATTSAQILFLVSTGLYKYPRLAAVREIICNGWDAHIVSGKRDCPLQITINDKGLLSVRDFGDGIDHAKIQEIYLTAGDSTKVESDEETGGFGLGSKAPFAYRDHFTVISTHNGVRTMYAMAMSDSQSMGKPTAKVLHRGTSSESGVEVQLQLREEDIEQFEKIIRRVVYLGDINATFNGELMSVCGMDEAGSDLSILSKKYDGDMYINLQLGIRYGAVVYPLEIGDDFRSEFNEVIAHLKASFGSLKNCMLVMRAKPNTISMVPSREALLYNPRTTRTVIELLKGATEQLMKAASVDHCEQVSKIIAKMVTHGYSPTEMLAWRHDVSWPVVQSPADDKHADAYSKGLTDVPRSFTDEHITFEAKDLLANSENAHTPEQYAAWYVVYNYRTVMNNPRTKKFYGDELYRLAKLFGSFNSKMLRLFGQEYVGADWYRLFSRAVRSQITLPYLRALKGLVPDAHKRLFAFKNHSAANACGTWRNTKRVHNDPVEKSVFNLIPSELGGQLTMLDPVFMLVWDSKHLNMYSEGEYWYRKQVDIPKHSFVYLVKLSQDKHDATAVAKALRARGFKVIDRTPAMTETIERIKQAAREKAAELRARYELQKERGELKEKRATKEAIAGLCNAVEKNSLDLDKWQRVKSPEMIENPQAILVRRANKNTAQSLDNLMFDESIGLVRKYGKVVGITNREDTARRFYNAGAKPFAQFIMEEFSAALKAYPEILQHSADWAFFKTHENRLHDSYHMRLLMRKALALPQFCKQLGLSELGPEQSLWLGVYNRLVETSRYNPWGWNSSSIRLPDPSASVLDIIKRMSKATPDSKSLVETTANYLVDTNKIKKMHPKGQAALADFIFTITNL